MKIFNMRSTRREFLLSAAATAVLSPFAQDAASQQNSPAITDAAIEAKLARDPRRPQFHLLPAKTG